MPNYQNSKIYKLICNETTDIYIGSTTEKLCVRFNKHKYDWSHPTKKNVTSSLIFNMGEAKIILIENYPCNNVDELRAREQFYIDSLDCVNKQSAKKKENANQIAKKKYRESEKGKQTEKKWEENHRELRREYSKKYLQNNRDKVNERKRVKVECPHCKKVMNKNSLSTHLKRKHIISNAESVGEVEEGEASI